MKRPNIKPAFVKCITYCKSRLWIEYRCEVSSIQIFKQRVPKFVLTSKWIILFLLCQFFSICGGVVFILEAREFLNVTHRLWYTTPEFKLSLITATYWKKILQAVTFTQSITCMISRASGFWVSLPVNSKRTTNIYTIKKRICALC